MNQPQEDKTSYYYVNGQKLPLAKEPGVYAVRFKPGEKSDSPRLSKKGFRFLREDSENVQFLPNYGLQVYRSTRSVPRSATEEVNARQMLEREIQELDHEEAVEYATPAYRRAPASDELMYLTNHFVAKFKSGVTPQQIETLNARYGVKILESVGYADNAYLLEAPEGAGERGPVALANVYFESGLCDFANPDFVRKVHFRSAQRPRVYELARDINVSNEEMLDLLHDMGVDVKSHMSTVDDDLRYRVRQRLQPETSATAAARVAPKSVPREAPAIETHIAERTEFLNQQWHLQTAKVTDAWTITRGSSAIKIAVMDDGIDTLHPEFANKVAAQFDFEAKIADATPKTPDDNHGTACAGVAVAGGTRAAGAAPACSLLAIRTPSFLGVADEATMFRWAADQGADVISCSWGPADGTGQNDPLPDTTRAAIQYCMTQGRGGKGIPVFWAAGNGNESVSLDGYASNPDVIAVAASTSKETRAHYSDFGPEIAICAPSSGSSAKGEKRIFTVDRRGASGYNPGENSLGDGGGDYTNDFGGTSSATPLVAGIAGLVLATNPNLRVSDVRSVLTQTADKIADASSYNSSGHSDLFGFGRVNALRAVQRARDLAQGTTPTTSQGPTMTGPASVDANGAPPTFQIGLGANRCYAVEIATIANLFSSAQASDQRTADNYYASWQDQPFQTSATWQLPQAIWDRLKAASSLFYRVHTSSSTSDWQNYQVSVADDRASEAPSTQITRGGSSTQPTPTTGPGISGPASANQSDNPPTFTIALGGNSHYAVEFATRANLFNQAQHGSERNDNNWYGSWQDQALQTNPSYTMPQVVWDRLKLGAAIFYRVHTTSSASAWENYAVSTSDEQADSAPALQINAGPLPSTTGASIRGPATIGASDSAPTFQVSAGSGRFYAVEVASSATLFDSANHGSERNENNWYGSWSDQALQSAASWTLPTPVWQRLCNGAQLFYRLHVSSSATEWTDYAVSTADDQAAAAPVIQISGGAPRLERTIAEERAGRPSVMAAEMYDRAADAPAFLVSPGDYRYYVFEIATDPQLFNAALNSRKRTDENFFSTWQFGPSESFGETTFRLPETAWRTLRKADRLFYRICTSNEPSRSRPDFVCSIPDDQSDDCSWITLKGGNVAKSAIAPAISITRSSEERQTEEEHWRE